MTLLLLLHGCLRHRVAPVDEDRLQGPLLEADRAWEHRGVDGGIEAALATYEALLPIAPEDPRLLARLARAHHALALCAPDPATSLREYEITRELGVACLVAEPAVAEALRGARQRWTGTVVGAVPEARGPCLTWAAAGAVGTVEVRGPGAAVELDAARAFAVGAIARDPEGGWATRSRAMTALLDPRADAEARAAGVEGLEAARTLAPALDWFVVDLAWARGETPELPPVREDDPLRHENEAARRRATSR